MAFPYIPLATALAEFVPLIARWIGGENSEKHAQKIVETAKRITGHSTPHDVLEALRQNPKFVIEFQKALLQMEDGMERALLQDRQSARLRDIALTQTGRINRRADIMVISAAIGLISCLVTITVFRDSLPGEAVGIISTIAGIFGACLKDAYAFEFGSSRGSKLKDLKMASIMLGSV